jgi:putative alpha-1,2-mannosidase
MTCFRQNSTIIYIFIYLLFFVQSCDYNKELPLESIIEESEEDLVQYVNPLVGTAWKGNGGTLPSVTTPFGMTHFVPVTNENRIGMTPYHYEMDKLIGFMATHQPTVWMGDYGYVSFMPQIDNIGLAPEDRAIGFDHSEEFSAPNRYTVKLRDSLNNTIEVDFSATERCGIFEISYPEKSLPYLLIEASRDDKFQGHISINSRKREITGYNSDRHSSHLGPVLENFYGYFVMEFNNGFDSYGTWEEGVLHNNISSIIGNKIGAYLSFGSEAKSTVTLKIGTSFISIDQARENLRKEIPHWNIDKTADETKDKWQKMLNRVRIPDAMQEQKRIFYTAMYHSLLYPRTFSEYGRYYSAFDDSVHQGVSYNDYSLWDTFRALHPLLIFIAPEHVSPMVQSLLQMYREGGWLPKWPNPSYTNIMIGTHADAVIADAFLKGYRDYDTEEAYQAIRKNAFVPPEGDTDKSSWYSSPWDVFKGPIPPGAGNAWWDRQEWIGYEARGGLTWYDKYGYVPSDKTRESVSRTLEFAYGDFCVAQMARQLGKEEDYVYLTERSKNYKNLYNPATGFMAPKLSNGRWSPDTLPHNPPIGPERFTGFTEGGPWTYLFCAMHDIPGLIELMGGQETFLEKLEENFREGHYKHNNEPGHHYIYLFNFCGKPSRTQELIDNYLEENYNDSPSGINGNDDCGQMSAWYIFSSMGFYPVAPSDGKYAIGKPRFDEIFMDIPDQDTIKTIRILRKNNSAKNIWVESVYLNDIKLTEPFFTHNELVNADSVVFFMGDEPVDNWETP